MRKTMLVALAAVAAFSLLLFVGCSKSEAPASAPAATTVSVAPAPAPTPAPAPAVAVAPTQLPDTYADGIYFAMADSFASSGWKETVTLTVSGGKITEADWNAVHVNGGADKKTHDKAGKYNMVRFGNAQDEWYVQAQKAEAFLLEKQDPTMITYIDDNGHTDDIAGVSVHVDSFFELAAQALASGPVGRGDYADGAYFAIADALFAPGWREYVSLTVLNGRIASANWSAINHNGDDKKTFDKAGRYGMVQRGNAQSEWYVQAQKAEAFLIEHQDPNAITYTDDQGHTDAIAGVSVHVDALFNLAAKALEAGPAPIGPYADGGYFAVADAPAASGWRGFVSLLVNNGNIQSAYWSGTDKDNRDKKQVAATGGYNMIAVSNIQKEWHEQAAAVEAHLLATQDPKQITYKDGASLTDDIAGATIRVNEFFDLAAKALAAGPKRY